MGDHKCPRCENNTFQVRGDGQRAVTFICVACWREWKVEDLTRGNMRLAPTASASAGALFAAKR